MAGCATETDVERDMSVFPYPAQKQFNSTHSLDARLVFVALADQVFRIAVWVNVQSQ
jgi:hypothetical protein